MVQDTGYRIKVTAYTVYFIYVLYIMYTVHYISSRSEHYVICILYSIFPLCNMHYTVHYISSMLCATVYFLRSVQYISFM